MVPAKRLSFCFCHTSYTYLDFIILSDNGDLEIPGRNLIRTDPIWITKPDS